MPPMDALVRPRSAGIRLGGLSGCPLKVYQIIERLHAASQSSKSPLGAGPLGVSFSQ